MSSTEKLLRKETPLTSKVQTDEFTDLASKAFDYKFEGISEFFPYEVPDLGEFDIGLVVGASGSGKSLLVNDLGEVNDLPEWDEDKAIVSHFDTPEDAIEKLSAVGLNSIPSWCRPFNALSTGEKFRANLARQLKDGAIIDEFTSVVDRNVAKSTVCSVSKYIKRNKLKNVVFASCHYDIIEWLEPSWVIDTSIGYLARGSLQRPKISIQIFETDYKSWEMFKDHHYLDAKINKSAKCFLAVWENQIVGFQATLAMPSGTIKNAFRGHRTVILPDFQGLGLGSKFSDAIGEIYIGEGKRFFSRTAHPRLGEYRQNSKKWRPTSKNKVLRKDVAKNQELGTKALWHFWKADGNRVCYSHEYIGETLD